MLNGQEFQSLFLVFELSQPIWDCYNSQADREYLMTINQDLSE